MVDDVLEQFRAALEGRGIIPPATIVADGHLHRCDTEGRNGKGDGAYIFFADSHPAGGFQNWRDGAGWENWQADRADRDPAADREWRARLDAIAKARDAEQKARAQDARQRAAAIWESSPPAPADHPYLTRKQIAPHGARLHLATGGLIVPIRDANGVVDSLQFIAPEGGKRFLRGGRKQGGYYLLGDPRGTTLCVAEGFATAATVFEATGFATAVAFDAGNLEPVAKALRKAHPKAVICLCADDDHKTAGNPGQTAAAAAARAVRGVVAVPDFGRPRPDWATDFNDLARLLGPTAVAMQVDIAIAPDGARLEVVNLADVEAEPVGWVWPGRIPRGKLTLLAGYGGLGKSQVTASMAATVTTGGKWPVTGEPFGDPADVLFLSAEDDAADTIRPRLEAAGADLRRCRLLGSVTMSAPHGRPGRRCFNLLEDLPHLERELRRNPATRLIVIDPLSAYMGDSRRVDTHKTSDVRSVLMPLTDLASAYRVAVVGIFHLNKREGSSAMDRINGSGAFVAAARAVWLIARDKDDKRHRVFVQVKNNLAPDQDGLKFEISATDITTPAGRVETSRVMWLPDVVTIDADDALAGGGGTTARRSALDEAIGFIKGLLKNGPMPAEEVYTKADAAGHAKRTVDRAKKGAGIRSGKPPEAGGRWVWALEDCQDCQDCQDNP
ncbi:MAG: AAA family ATPase [Candidatus Competibacter sp.]|nr:AAA family ATPase [Candidatus Competibacter sp.]